MSNQLSITKSDLASIKMPAKTLRHHSPRKLKNLTKNVDRFGILIPVLVDRTGSIIDGVARYQAAKVLGLTHIPVIDCSFLTEDEVRVLRLSLNRLPADANWDKDAVANELRHLVEVGFDLDFTGFETVEIENLLEIGEPEADVEEITISPVPAVTVSKVGDVWGLGSGGAQHRVACGDFRDHGLCEVLFDEAQASAAFTDPPYNVKIQGHVSGTAKHKEFAHASGEMTPAQFEAFLLKGCEVLFRHLKTNSVAFVCMDWRHIQNLLNASGAAGFELLNIAVWTKTNPGMGSFYRSAHELVAVFRRQGDTHRNNIELGRHGRSRSNVWSYRGVNVFGAERHLLNSHPTPKPSALVADAIRDVTVPGEIVFDAFLGSGTTLIAAHRTKRRCYGTEIEPTFVDLSIRRWQLETGLDAIRLADGANFTDLENAAIQHLAAEGSVRP
jgi:DNA modification methylase